MLLTKNLSNKIREWRHVHLLKGGVGVGETVAMFRLPEMKTVYEVNQSEILPTFRDVPSDLNCTASAGNRATHKYTDCPATLLRNILPNGGQDRDHRIYGTGFF